MCYVVIHIWEDVHHSTCCLGIQVGRVYSIQCVVWVYTFGKFTLFNVLFIDRRLGSL